MSYSTWHNYGYGICTADLKIDSVDRIEQLLTFAPVFHEEINDYFDDCDIQEPTIEDYLEFDQDYCYGIAAILKEVCEEATGIEFCACDDFNGNCYVIYMPTYPWRMTERDQTITKEELNEIFNRFVPIITDTKFEIDYQEVENGG